MTPLFIKEFSKEQKCYSCTAKQMKGRKFCAYHLRMARERFSSWCMERRAKERCIHCNRHSFKGASGSELRCAHHKKINRIRCRTWSALRRAKAKETGVCQFHNHPVIPNTTWCEVCKGNRRARVLARKQQNA